MSSTLRTPESRAAADYYVTPHYVIRNFLDAWKQRPTPESLDGSVILDPCAGGDQFNPMSYPTVLTEYKYRNIATVDIREDSLADNKADYLKLSAPDKAVSMIITNPPFALALPIIQKALKDVCGGGYVIMLLRLNFFGTQARFSFWQENMPVSCFVHSKRISFLGAKPKPSRIRESKLVVDEHGAGSFVPPLGRQSPSTTDSIEYMHCVWQRGQNPETCALRVI